MIFIFLHLRSLICSPLRPYPSLCCEEWSDLHKWFSCGHLSDCLNCSTLIRRQNVTVAFNRSCSTLNTEPFFSSSCKPMVLCCRFSARDHVGLFVFKAKRPLLIIEISTWWNMSWMMIWVFETMAAKGLSRCFMGGKAWVKGFLLTHWWTLVPCIVAEQWK